MKNSSYSPNKEIIYTNNFLFYLNLFRLIRSSTKSIHISLYIFELDRTGQWILKELLNACERGVEVNLILDGIGSINYYNQIEEKTRSYNNFNLHLYNPPPWPFSRIKLSHHFKNKLLFSLFKKINNRNHSKIFIFDNSTVMLGSHNIFDNSRFWRETSLKIQDPEVSNSCLFLISWLQENSFLVRRSLNKRVKKNKGFNKTIFLALSRYTHNLFRVELIQRIEQSRHQIQIIMPYFFPPIKVMNALIKAAKNGVLIEIILPTRSDVFLFPRLSRLFYKKLMASNVQIYEYSKEMIHAKQIRIDDWLIVGSSNLNPRSLFRDIEINYVVQQKGTFSKVESVFNMDKLNSIKIITPPKNRWENIASFIFSKIFRAWL